MTTLSMSEQQPEFKVLVCGGRDYADRDNVIRWLDKLLAPHYPRDTEGAVGTWLPRPDLHLIAGGAPGVDTYALDWAVVNWCRFTEVKADWDRHGKAACPIRNQTMLEMNPDLVIAF